MVQGMSGQYPPSFYGLNRGVYNGIKATATVHANDLNNLIKFATNQPITEIPDPTLAQTITGSMPMIGGFGLLTQAAPWAWSNRKDLKGAAALLKQEALINGQKDVVGTFKNEFTKYSTRIFKGLTDAEKQALLNTPRNWFGKTLDWIPGYQKLRVSGFGQAMGKSGAGVMIAMDGIISLFTDVIPAYNNIGFASGTKQIGKSSVKVAATAAGWVSGEAIGAPIGAAIGTFIAPGIGNKVGSFVGGMIGGLVGTHFAAKGAKALTGKSEMEKFKEKQLDAQKTELQNNPEMQIALAQQSLAAAEQILAQDPQNAEAIAAKEAATNVLSTFENITEQNQAPVQAQRPNVQTPQYNQSQFGGLNIPPVPGFNGTSYDMEAYRKAISTASMPNFSQTNPFTYQQQTQIQPQVQTQPAA